MLRHRISYLTDDLVVPAWNGAFVYDTDAGAMATLEILEFVNSQLLEFRYFDEQLESELTRIYATLQQPRRTDWIVGRRYSRAARQLQSAFIDVNELTDRLENALKLVGDLYAARLANLASARLGIDSWRRSVKEKLDTLDDIYQFAVEQTGMSQGNILERGPNAARHAASVLTPEASRRSGGRRARGERTRPIRPRSVEPQAVREPDPAANFGCEVLEE